MTTHNRLLRLDDMQHRRLRMAAAATGVSQQKYISAAIDAAFDRTAEDNALLALVYEYLKPEASRE